MIVLVSVTNDLVTDQRVHKVCSTLSEQGYDVKLIGRKLKSSAPIDRPYRTHRMRLLFTRSFFFYAEYNLRLFFYLLFSKADVLLANDTDTLVANYLVSRMRRKPLVFDAHEMFPEVPEVTHRKLVKAVWTRIEDWIFPKLRNAYTVCQSIADIYNDRYGINMQVVRNIPFRSLATTTESRLDKKGKKVLLYQGAVNIGRGLEWIIDTMPLLDEFIFYIIGDGDVMEELKERVKQRGVEDRVIFTGRIPFEELPAYTAVADIGINLLENRGLNYYYALPNRIFDYIRKNIPILANDFPEIKRVVDHYGVGKLVSRFEPEHLAKAIRELAAQEKNTEGFARANEELTWENEAITITNIFEKL